MRHCQNCGAADKRYCYCQSNYKLHQESEIKTLRLALKERDDLIAKKDEALKESLRWQGKTGDIVEDFDDIADWFYLETGMMRPGKDQAGYGHSDEERNKTFNGWRHKKLLEIRHRIITALALKVGGKL